MPAGKRKYRRKRTYKRRWGARARSKKKTVKRRAKSWKSRVKKARFKRQRLQLLCEPKMPLRMSQYKVCKHTYMEHFSVAQGVAANNYVLLQTCRTNDIFDPDKSLTIDGKKVNGVTEMAAKYGQWTCIGSKIDVYMHPPTPTISESWETTQYQLVVTSSQRYIAPTWASFLELSRQVKNSKMIKMHFSGSGDNRMTHVSNKWSWKMTPTTRGNFLNNDNYKAAVNTHPASPLDYDILTYKKTSANGYTNPKMEFDVRITYIVVWQEPKLDFVTG